MRILLIGHGRMGRLVEQTALAAGDEIVGAVDSGCSALLSERLYPAEVIIDFSSPAAFPAAADYVRRTGTPFLSGTTGLSDGDMDTLSALGRYAPVLHSANFSVGVAVFLQMLEQYSAVLTPDYDVEIIETHHNQKADAPSGTAKLLLSAIDPDGQMTPVYGREGMCGRRGRKEIGIHAVRGGTVAGTHTVSFFGADEELSITHRAASRQIFANGALAAARRLCALPKGRYEFRDILFGGENA